jgi:DNA-directed RNA polymerase specialized sigma24 family protein
MRLRAYRSCELNHVEFQAQTKIIVDELLDRIHPDDAFLLYQVARGHRKTTVARFLGVPESTVRYRYNRALKRLQAIIKQEGIGL